MANARCKISRQHPAGFVFWLGAICVVHISTRVNACLNERNQINITVRDWFNDANRTNSFFS